MTPTFALHRRILWTGLLWIATAFAVQAAEIRVITSGAFTESYKKLVPIFEAASGHKVLSSFGASIGKAPDSIPSRFERVEKFDLVILSEGGLEALDRKSTRLNSSHT